MIFVTKFKLMRLFKVFIKALCLFIVVIFGGDLVSAKGELIPNELIANARKQYGDEAARSIEAWQKTMMDLKNASEMTKLKVINRFFNKSIPFKSDLAHWQKEDYWATPYQSLITQGGDCEDYVIAKYYSLIKLGVDVKKLRITYVNALRINQAHMVLAYFRYPDETPLVLDNLDPRIKRANKRRDLEPVYSFNATGMWLDKMKGKGVLMGNPNKLDLWTNLRVRMQQQGMDL